MKSNDISQTKTKVSDTSGEVLIKQQNTIERHVIINGTHIRVKVFSVTFLSKGRLRVSLKANWHN